MATKAKQPKAKQQAPSSNGHIRIDPSKMTLRDVREMEKLTGKPMVKLFEGGGMTSEGLAAYIAAKQREVDPTFTLDDAYNVEMQRLDVDAPPTQPATGPAETA